MGVCLSELHVLATAEDQLGAEVDEVEIGGRGTSEPPWQEARLAVLGRPLRLLEDPDPSALGAAMLGAAAEAGGHLAAARILRGSRRVAAPTPSDRELAPRRLARYLLASGVSLQWAEGS
jgi:xylulokinase